jgi:hypothetical protein
MQMRWAAALLAAVTAFSTIEARADAVEYIDKSKQITLIVN